MRPGGRGPMSARWGVLLALSAGCDDVIFGEQPLPPLSQEGWAGVTEVIDGYCLGCHSAQGAFGQLDLETDPYGALVGVTSSDGSSLLVDPGAPDSSLLYLKITGDQPAGGPMPPDVELSQEATDIVRDWIADGAPEQ